MGIFSKPNQPSPYVPQKTGALTLLGDSAQPAAGTNDDLNKSPATTVSLHFAPVLNSTGGATHGYIVVTDIASGRQWTSEGGPDGARMSGILPGGHLAASTVKNGPGDRPGSRQVASFTTDVSADEVAGRLTNFATNFTAKKLPYNLPYFGPVDPLGIVMRAPVRNSNYYIGAAWDDMRGTLPILPGNLLAPGWGDHRKPNEQ